MAVTRRRSLVTGGKFDVWIETSVVAPTKTHAIMMVLLFFPVPAPAAFRAILSPGSGKFFLQLSMLQPGLADPEGQTAEATVRNLVRALCVTPHPIHEHKLLPVVLVWL